MDKLILINKPSDITSRDVINKICKKFSIKKVGHFGTLDPLASGLLVVGVGALTKIESLFNNSNKEYIVRVLIGTSTDSYDITGNIVSKKEGPFDQNLIEKELISFIGTYEQEVPIYSAVKVNGKKLYEYARNGEDITLPKRNVDIISISDISFDKNYLKFKCLVSKGTYIRSLINDLSKKCNIPMCMDALIRTRSGNFSLDDANTIEDIENDNLRFLDITDIFDLDIKEIPDELEKKIVNGNIIDKVSDKMILFCKNGEYISLYAVYNDKMKPVLTFKKYDI